MKTVILDIDSDIRFILTQDGRGSSIRSEGLESVCYADEDRATYYDSCKECYGFEVAVSSVCSLILGHFQAGMDITTEAYKMGVQAAIQDFIRYADCQYDKGDN